MKKKFDWIMCFLSWGLSAAVAAVCWYIFEKTNLLPEGSMGRIGKSLLFLTLPLLGGLSGVCLTEQIRRRRFVTQGGGNRGRGFLLALAAGILLGGGGQVIYMLTVQEYETEPETEAESVYSDLVLLLDCSNSMQGKKASCAEAARQLTKGLEEGNAMQVIAFSGKVIGETELLFLDQSGKRTTTDFIDGIDVVGGTNFIAGFESAFETLRESVTGNERQAVILVTDGRGDLNEEIKENYLEENILVYSIRLTGEETVDEQSRKLIEFVEATGGFNTEIQVDAQGDISVEKLLEALESAAREISEPSYEKRLAFGEQLLIAGSQGMGLRHYGIRFLIFMVYGLVITWIYYRRAALKNLIGCAGAAALMTAAVRILPFAAALPVYCLLFWTAFTTYHFREEETYV